MFRRLKYCEKYLDAGHHRAVPSRTEHKMLCSEVHISPIGIALSHLHCFPREHRHFVFSFRLDNYKGAA